MKHIVFALTLLLGAIPTVFAQVVVTEPWVRATVPAQKATGAFMQLKSVKDARLVGASSPVAGMVEIHEMAMVGDVMKMRAVQGIDMPGGKIVDLSPNGYHVMLMNLKSQIKEGDSVPISLVVESRDKKRSTIEVKAIARPLASAPAEKMKMH